MSTDTAPLLAKIAEEFERSERECRETAERIEKANETGILIVRSALAVHYRKNQEYFGSRGRAIRAAIAELEQAVRTIETSRGERMSDYV